jgi:tetratricopeptide (TPR) repeat protein
MTATDIHREALVALLRNTAGITDRTERLARFKALSEQHADQSLAWRGRAEMLWRAGEHTAALPHYRRAVLLDPTDQDALKRLGLHHLHGKKWRQALPFFRSLNVLDPNNRTELGRTGRLHFKLGNDAQSLACFQRLYQLAPQAIVAAALKQKLHAAPAAFIHLPKTGGTSVEHALAGRLPSIHHRIIGDDARDHNDDYYTATVPSVLGLGTRLQRGSGPKFFTNIRNIYSLLVSLYHWSRDAQWQFPQQFDNNIPESLSFEDYIHRLANRETPWPSRHFLNIQLFSHPSGALAVDWINRMEHLQEDMAAMTEAWGLQTVDIGHQNANTKGDYRGWYSDKLADLVRDTWRADVDLFGFTFDGYGEVGAWGDVTHLRGELRYDVRTRMPSSD